MPLKKTTALQVKDDLNAYIKDDVGLKMIMEEVFSFFSINLEHVR